jgi:hypothetical protein
MAAEWAQAPVVKRGLRGLGQTPGEWGYAATGQTPGEWGYAATGQTPVVERGYAIAGSVAILTRYGTPEANARRRAGAIPAGAVTSSPAPPSAATTWS